MLIRLFLKLRGLDLNLISKCKVKMSMLSLYERKIIELSAYRILPAHN